MSYREEAAGTDMAALDGFTRMMPLRPLVGHSQSACIYRPRTTLQYTRPLCLCSPGVNLRHRVDHLVEHLENLPSYHAVYPAYRDFYRRSTGMLPSA